MRLGRIIESLTTESISGSKDIEVAGIVYDSRQAFPGSMFCCIEGFTFDGHRFIQDAITRGATSLCLQKDSDVPEGITRIKVPDTREALARMSARFYEDPSRSLSVIGVTGTNGKTTTTFLIEHILGRCGRKTGLMGTLLVKIGDQATTAKHTTPESLDLQSTLAQMVAAGMEYAVLEVSSHALSLKRVDQCVFQRAVFTNLTQDHLDFHRDLDDYFQAKLKFFTFLKKDEGHMAIINSDDPRAGRIIEALTVPHLTYGIRNAQADYRAEKVQVTPGGVEYDLRAAGVVTHVKLGISGLFNVYNSLAALTTVCSLGVSLDEALKAVEDFQGVRGRFQMVRKGQQFAVVVDYAHTPDGLENILKAAREITSRSLITVFGCGGDRDRTKRPLMGKIAATLSDSVIITSDNPRTEDPGKILQDIEEGVRPVKSDYEKIVDRRDAIGRALHRAQPGDTVVVAGKGHENYQIFKDRTIHFDDVEVVEEQLGGLGY